MSQLTDNLNLIASIKSDISAAIEAKGVSMSGVSFGSYADKIGEIQTGGQFVTEPLSVSVNGTYVPSQGVDGYSQVTVNVPQSVTGFTEKDVTEGVNVINLSNSASYVFSYVFKDHNELTTVNLPNCTIVNEFAFYKCINLTTVNLPICGIIGASAFMSCYSLSQINVPVCLSISACAFRSCSSLSQINIPVVTNISNSVFQDCTTLNSLTLCTDVYWTIPYQATMLSKTPIMSGTGSIYVRSDTYSAWITSTGWSSLSNRFVSVETSGIALSYSEGTVYGTTKVLNKDFVNFLGISKSDITIVSLPECCYLAQSALVYMSLNSVYLPECLGLYNTAFENTFISSIDLPKCKQLMYGAIKDCRSTDNISIPRCEFIGDRAFTGCFRLQSINLPLCSYIGDYVFNNCYSLSEASLPICEHIGNSAFQGCGLSSLNLPVCSYIGSDVFNTTTFKTLVLGYSSIVTTPGSRVFINTVPSIFVPTSLVDAYKSALIWSQYSSKIFPIPE